MHLKEGEPYARPVAGTGGGYRRCNRVGTGGRDRDSRATACCAFDVPLIIGTNSRYSAVSGCPELAGLQQQIRRLDAVRTRRPAADCPGVGERPADTRLFTRPRVGGTRVISLDALQLPHLMAYAMESEDDLRVGIELQLVLDLLRIDQTIAQ